MATSPRDRRASIRSPDAAITLANSVRIPRLGLGTYKAADGGEVERAVRVALAAGYRHIDTASLYGNEEGIGRVLEASGLSRAEVFLATKVWNEEQGYEGVWAAIEGSLARLRTEYVDLYLVHWPVPGLMVDTWRAMEEIRAAGKARAIGVCNHLVHHLARLLEVAAMPPLVNQFEHHPRLQQRDLMAFCREHGIQPEAWAPIMRGGVFDIAELVRIGRRHGKDAAQVTLRWTLQKGIVAIPKSVREERIRSNADIFDFELDADEVAAIDALDAGHRIGPHPDTFVG